MNVLEIKHGPNTGFFSNCSVRLHRIVRHLNKHKRLPEAICSRNQFQLYKSDAEMDVAKLLFVEDAEMQIPYRHRIDYVHVKQFSNYKLLRFPDLLPFLKKYFTVSGLVTRRKLELIREYHLDFQNTIGVIYRGNDKVSETSLPPYDAFFARAAQLNTEHPGMKFLVQTDELEFRNEFCARFPNSIYFESLPPIPRSSGLAIVPTEDNRFAFALEILSAVQCLSLCRFLITGSGNVDIWTVFFRGHTEGLFQFFKGRFVDRDNVRLGRIVVKWERYFSKIGWVYRWIGRRYFGFKPV